MSDITNEKPHHRYGKGYNVSFWRDGAASNEESATHAIVYTGAPGMPYPDVKFSLIHADERRQMEDLEIMLQNSFAAGDAHARQEIRKVLGIVPR